MKLKHASLAAVAAAAAASALAVPALTSAQQAPVTITVQEKIQAIAGDDIKPKGRKLSLGDRTVTRQSLFDAAKKPLGTLYTDCSGAGPTQPFPAATLLCTISYKLAGGQIVAAGALKLDGSIDIPIVAGTGVYAGARGSIKSAQPASGYDGADVITITG